MKVEEDPSYILLLRKKFAYLESIPGVLLPHPATPAIPVTPDSMQVQMQESYDQQMDFWANQQVRIMPNSLDALLSKLPAVGPTSGDMYGEIPVLMAAQKHEMERAVLKDEMEVNGGETSGSMNYLVNVANPMLWCMNLLFGLIWCGALIVCIALYVGNLNSKLMLSGYISYNLDSVLWVRLTKHSDVLQTTYQAGYKFLI